MIILASISSSSSPILRRITIRPALERAPMGRGQICGGGRGGFLGAKSTPCKLLCGFFAFFAWICDFGLLKVDDCCNTTAEDFIIAEDFSASLGSDEGKMVESRRELIHFAPELGLGEL